MIKYVRIILLENKAKKSQSIWKKPRAKIEFIISLVKVDNTALSSFIWFVFSNIRLKRINSRIYRLDVNKSVNIKRSRKIDEK